ncbi:MFS transporter [Nocardiopsis tropica]|uniref:MFS transporter n=1 Tax=Nocardiopsis tropica TaxID=109330 RepID=A0ABU7KIE1_9ACTN|nr:MFS transporter [Nocardiopsis umidischolae]MEE2049052.1 MFS transporter [Nocardiopsis umidischolae]
MGAEVGERDTRPGTAGANLALATAAFALTFWAWNLVGPLSRTYTQELDLSPSQTSLLVAFPVLVGSLGRIPVGSLTDRYGGRLMFTVICFVSIVPTFLVGVSSGSYAMLLVWGFFLGIAGTSFAVGIPFVNAWYRAGRRGFATGVFGAGMGGTALSSFLTPLLVEKTGVLTTHLLMCAALAAMGAVMWVFSRDSPAWRPRTEPALPGMREALGLKATWQASLLYAVAFGGFVAFSTYLPTLLTMAYDYAQTDAGVRTAGFAVAAVIARPVGGILSDRLGPARVCLASFLGTCVFAVVLALHPPAEFPAGAAFVLIALSLGLGTGAVFALVAKLVDPSRVGTVTGLVGAAGGLGGYFPPLLMGVVYQATGAYTLGFVLLAAVSLAVALYTSRAFRGVSA